MQLAPGMQFSYTPDRKIHILDRLAWSEMFESFLANKFAAAKRFGLEGCETLVPGMKALIDRSTDMGVDSIVMGMPHRGVPVSKALCSAVSGRLSCVSMYMIWSSKQSYFSKLAHLYV